MMTGAVSSRRAPNRARPRLTAAVAAAALACFAALAAPARAAVVDGYKTVGGLAVYLGVLPAAIVRGHDPRHAEATMHGGAPRGRDGHHLVVAVFDAASGARVEDAEVSATISEPGHVARTRLPLEPMRVADTTTYGGFAALPGRGRYAIDVEIRRPGAEPPARVGFAYEHD